MSRLIRQWVLSAALALAPLAMPAGDRPQEKALRIGFQKFGELILLKSRGTLEKKAAALGYKVTWIEFPAGPQLCRR